MNAECDITGVDAEFVAELSASGALIGNPIITNSTVSFSLEAGVDRSALAPRFELTEGATIGVLDESGAEVFDANGSVQDFTSPKYYVVHSQDGNWCKTYRVSFSQTTLVMPVSFEHMKINGKYGVFYEIDEASGDTLSYWASGNPGYSMSGMAETYKDFPTVIDEDGYEGSCVRLTTCSTGSFGHNAGMPIAAGSVFIGEFNTSVAVTAPLKATKMGLQLLTKVPTRLSGWHKYARGAVFQDASEAVLPDEKDAFDIYSVVFECDADNFVSLNGADVQTSDRIVCMAQFTQSDTASVWTHFDVPYVFMNGHTEFDRERLASKGYGFALVASSSRDGHLFQGAVGSTLYVDELKVTWEDDDE